LGPGCPVPLPLSVPGRGSAAQHEVSDFISKIAYLCGEGVELVDIVNPLSDQTDISDLKFEIIVNYKMRKIVSNH
jgi:hypothetical protein